MVLAVLALILGAGLVHGVLSAAFAAAVVAGAGWFCHRQQRAQWEVARAQGLHYALPQLHALHHSRFEETVRELMHRDGCQDAQRVGGRGTLGAD